MVALVFYCYKKELELEETKECELVFSEFLRFFYCGRISFTPETALPLLVLACKYRVQALRTACDSYISNLIEDGDLKNSLRWLKYATRYNLHVSFILNFLFIADKYIIDLDTNPC